MNLTTKRRIGKIITPFAIMALKLYSRITGTERARMLVRNENGHILLVQGFVGEGWTLPGGGIKRKESPLKGAVRELHEETGIIVHESDVRHVTTFSRTESPLRYTAHIYTVTVASSDLPKGLYNPGEIIEIGWYAPDSLPPHTSVLVGLSVSALLK